MHSKNFEKVKKYYDEGLWDKDKVRNMVTNPKSNPWITTEEYEEITGEPYKS
ncbi:MAG: XkdX family protein [Lachnospiraceae bacterium]|nr:XkdX family protein [Lachnospiraceae bacterium]